MSEGHPLLLIQFIFPLQGKHDQVAQKGTFMTRHQLREQVFLLLFRADFYDTEGLQEQETLFAETLKKASEQDLIQIKAKYHGILENLSEIDSIINDRTKGWKTSRMGKAELTILRLAVYELLYDEEIPTGVAINEAVELAKEYGTEEASSFVNGVLAKVAAEQE